MSGITSPVKTCDISDNPLADATAQSGCAGGTAYMCSDQSPWAINDDLAYGFAAVSAGDPNCCSCYQLTFTSTVLSGKKMIVQATNTGDDVGSTQFDLAVSLSAFYSLNTGSRYRCLGADSDNSMAARRNGKPLQLYGEHSTADHLPTPALRSQPRYNLAAISAGIGCKGLTIQRTSDPPVHAVLTDTISVDWEVVTCPAELVAKSGCSVTGYDSANAPPAPASSLAAPVPSPKASASSPPAPVASKPPAESPVEKSTASPKAVAPATTFSPVVVHTSPPAVPTKASLPPQPAKAAPSHPHWVPHESSDEEKEHTEWTPPKDMELAKEEGKQDACDA